VPAWNDVISCPKERVRRRAYEMYLELGGEPGGELNDWLRAERESNKTLSLSM